MAEPFIRTVNLTPHRHIDQAILCHVQFDSRFWDDNLFARLDIPFPDHLQRAATKRKAEYLAGRYGCRQILQLWGVHHGVATGTHREPLWPRGVAGSLSHTADRAVALLIPSRYGVTPGIDIESADGTTLLAAAEQIVSPAEQALLAATSLTEVEGLLLAFSIKESLFKGLFPRVGHYFGFEAARLIDINPARGEVTLALTEDLAEGAKSQDIFYGYFDFNGGLITSSIACPENIFI